MTHPVLLTSRAAIRCARRTHNDFDPALDDSRGAEVEPTRWTQQGIDFEAVVRAYLLLQTRGSIDINCSGHSSAIERTQAAMNKGIPLIIGGALPDDPVGGRRGRPDLLIRAGLSPRGAGYLPGDIKSHVVARSAARGGAKATFLADLGGTAPPVQLPGFAPDSRHRLTDLMQLAHYWRLLEACGFASDRGPDAGLIGSDTFTDEPWLLWQRLDDPVFTTYSRTRGSAKRSALERYDHEFGFRYRIAEASRAEAEPLVRPIIVEECESCPWHDVCLEQVGDADPSRHITSGRLSVREWNALHAIGIRTVSDLSMLTLGDPLLDNYWGDVEFAEPRSRQRLADAITRAQMMQAGESLRRTTSGPIALRRADVEVDFDIEWDLDSRIYLWGLLVTDHNGERVESQVEWVTLDEASEAALASQVIATLMAMRDAAAINGHSFIVFHYSHPEVSMVRALLARGGDGLPTVAEWDAFVSRHFVDLWRVVKENYIGVTGLGLKQVAPWAGFHWNDDDPSGEASMQWIEQARNATDLDERQVWRDRLIQYNTDDVRATLAVRRRLADES